MTDYKEYSEALLKDLYSSTEEYKKLKSLVEELIVYYEKRPLSYSDFNKERKAFLNLKKFIINY